MGEELVCQPRVLVVDEVNKHCRCVKKNAICSFDVMVWPS